MLPQVLPQLFGQLLTTAPLTTALPFGQIDSERNKPESPSTASYNLHPGSVSLLKVESYLKYSFKCTSCYQVNCLPEPQSPQHFLLDKLKWNKQTRKHG